MTEIHQRGKNPIPKFNTLTWGTSVKHLPLWLTLFILQYHGVLPGLTHRSSVPHPIPSGANQVDWSHWIFPIKVNVLCLTWTYFMQDSTRMLLLIFMSVSLQTQMTGLWRHFINEIQNRLLHCGDEQQEGWIIPSLWAILTKKETAIIKAKIYYQFPVVVRESALEVISFCLQLSPSQVISCILMSHSSRVESLETPRLLVTIVASWQPPSSK